MGGRSRSIAAMVLSNIEMTPPVAMSAEAERVRVKELLSLASLRELRDPPLLCDLTGDEEAESA